MKGYERLLSLSKDIGNPRWKPLHLAASWNAKNRRNFKKLAKTNWYKGKSEIELQAADAVQGDILHGKDDAHSDSRREMKDHAPSNHQGSFQGECDYNAPSNNQGETSLQGGKRKR